MNQAKTITATEILARQAERLENPFEDLVEALGDRLFEIMLKYGTSKQIPPITKVPK